jgi:hypothetical protein
MAPVKKKRRPDGSSNEQKKTSAEIEYKLGEDGLPVLDEEGNPVKIVKPKKKSSGSGSGSHKAKHREAGVPAACDSKNTDSCGASSTAGTAGQQGGSKKKKSSGSASSTAGTAGQQGGSKKKNSSSSSSSSSKPAASPGTSTAKPAVSPSVPKSKKKKPSSSSAVRSTADAVVPSSPVSKKKKQKKAEDAAPVFDDDDSLCVAPIPPPVCSHIFAGTRMPA